jgi:hypothetical protein
MIYVTEKYRKYKLMCCSEASIQVVEQVADNSTRFSNILEGLKQSSILEEYDFD